MTRPDTDYIYQVLNSGQLSPHAFAVWLKLQELLAAGKTAIRKQDFKAVLRNGSLTTAVNELEVAGFAIMHSWNRWEVLK